MAPSQDWPEGAAGTGEFEETITIEVATAGPGTAVEKSMDAAREGPATAIVGLASGAVRASKLGVGSFGNASPSEAKPT